MGPISGPEPGRTNDPALTPRTDQSLVVVRKKPTGLDASLHFQAFGLRPHQSLVVIAEGRTVIHSTGFDVGFDFERASFAVGFHVLAFHSLIVCLSFFTACPCRMRTGYADTGGSYFKKCEIIF